MRIVLDTNVFISGIFWEGNFCSQIIDKWKRGKFAASVGFVQEEIVRNYILNQEEHHKETTLRTK